MNITVHEILGTPTRAERGRFGRNVVMSALQPIAPLGLAA